MKKAILILIGLLIPCVLMAVTINVPSEYTTIQEAVNNAIDGDSILVAAGEYEGAHVFDSPNNITLMGSGAFCENPTIITSIIGSDSSICVVLNNVSYWNISDLRIKETFEGVTYGRGGIKILGCNNVCLDRIFVEQILSSSHAAAFKEIGSSNVEISYSLFTGGIGDVICLQGGSDIDIRNLTIAGDGNGIIIREIIENTLTIENCISAFNGYTGIEFASAWQSYYSVQYNDSYANGYLGNDNFSGFIPDSTNFSASPLFVGGAAGFTWSDFQLHSTSPCIDAGNPASPLDPDNTIADIGAFYFDQGFGSVLSVWPLQLDYGNVLEGVESDLQFTIYNIGTETFSVGEPISSNPEVFFSNFDPADSLILPGDSLLLTATFTPSQLVTYNETMQVWDSFLDTVTISMRGTGFNAVQVNLTPFSAPIMIPEAGGSFEFNILARNVIQDPQTSDLWTLIYLPGIGTIEPLVVEALAISGGVAIDRDRTQEVPESAPAGMYTYYAFVGDYPWVIEDLDSFTFEKEGTDQGGALGAASDWICTGEGLEAWEIKLEDAIPSEYALLGAYPNPFNPTTAISIQLSALSHVNLSVYDISGRKVATLADGFRQAGSHEVTFDGSQLASGIYVYRLEMSGSGTTPTTVCGKMVLMK